jgi:hypothetical protein
MEIGKNTVLSVSLGTLGGVAFVMWQAFGVYDGLTDSVYSNTEATKKNSQQLAEVVHSLEMSRIDRRIDNAKKELRQIERWLRDDPEDDILLDQRDDLEDEIERLDKIRDCLLAGHESCET